MRATSVDIEAKRAAVEAEKEAAAEAASALGKAPKGPAIIPAWKKAKTDAEDVLLKIIHLCVLIMCGTLNENSFYLKSSVWPTCRKHQYVFISSFWVNE